MNRIVRYLWYLIAFLLTLEICVRAEATWRWGAPFWGPYSLDTLMVDDDLGRRNRPYARFEKWVINGQGFQGPELRIPKPEGVTRIGVAGASEIFGLYENPGCDITSQLRKLLEKSSPGKFEVVNLATPGMSIPRIVESYDRWMRKFDFDAVIFYPSAAMYLADQAPEFRRSVSIKSENSFGNDNSWNLRLPRKTWEMLRERIPAWLQVKLKWIQIEFNRLNMTNEQVWRKNAPDERVELFREHLMELVSILQRNGTHVIIATHANRFQNDSTNENDPYMLAWIRFIPKASGASILDMERRSNQVIREIVADHPVTVSDVEKKVGKNPDHFADFAHFTDSGAALVAEAMKDSIMGLFTLNRTFRCYR